MKPRSFTRGRWRIIWMSLIGALSSALLGSAEVAHAQIVAGITAATGSGPILSLISSAFGAQASNAGINFVIGYMEIILYWASYVFVYIATRLAAVIISLEGWLLEILLGLNSNIINSPFVHYGFSVVLSITNLGFVFAIIVMAIMTIVRSQSYGVKQILWKIVAGAIAANVIGLILAGTLMRFADDASAYLIRQSIPGNAGQVGNSTDAAAFRNSIINALAPQRAYVLDDGTSTSLIPKPSEAGAAGLNAGGSFASIAFSIYISAFFLAAIVVVLGSMLVMLLIRYVYMAGLLVVMPAIWILWIFPGTKSYYSKWWTKFIHWLLALLIMLFCFYLAMQMATALGIAKQGGANQYGFSLPGAATKGGATPIADATGNLIQQVVNQQAPSFLVMAFMVLGVIASATVGSPVASGTMKMLKGIGDTAKSFAKNGAQRAGRTVGDRARTAGQQTDARGQTTTAAQRFGRKISTVGGGIPLIGGAFRSAGSAVSGAGKLDTSKLDERAKKIEEKWKGDTREQTLQRFMKIGATTSNEEALAIMNKAIKTPGLIAQVTDEKHKEYIMRRAEAMGKDSELVPSDPSLAKFQQHKAVGEVVRNADGTYTERRPGKDEIDQTDTPEKIGRRIAAGIQKAEADKLSPTLFGEIDKTSGAWVSTSQQLVSALGGVNVGKLKQLYDTNGAAMDSFVKAMSSFRTEIEDAAGGTISAEIMTSEQIRDFAHKKNILITQGEASEFKRKLALVNDGKQIIGYEIKNNTGPVPVTPKIPSNGIGIPLS